MDKIIEAAIVLAILVIFSILSIKKKSLDREGVLIGNIIGLLFYIIGGLQKFLVIALFFVVADACTRLSRKNRAVSHEKRTTGNILGNSGAAFIALLINSEIAFFGAVAAALADTLSSEIGLLSKSKPRLITSLEKVEAGTDGGVTLLGLIASVAGAAIIGAIYFYWTGNMLVLPVIILAGFIGSIADSFFGALFETKGVLNNAEVNFLGSLAGALSALAMVSLL